MTDEQIKGTSVQADRVLYSIFALAGFLVLLCILFSGLRRFAFGFIVFSLMGFGIALIAKRMGDSQVNAKLNQLNQAINPKS